MLQVIEQVVGAMILLFVALDVILTVLYARIGTHGVARFGTEVLSDLLAEYLWLAFRRVATRTGRAHGNFLSFAAPVILVSIVFMWSALLVIGTAMILHPELGTSIRTSGRTPTGDAAELVAGLGEQGQLQTGYSQLAQLGAGITNQKETYQFYPVLFYFRYRETRYATSRMATVLLDSVSLIQSAIGAGEHAWIKRMAATRQIWLATMALVTTLDGAFVRGGSSHEQRATPDAETLARWRRRYVAAVRRFDEAGIDVARDEDAGFRTYVALRVRWQPYIDSLCQYMAQDPLEIDPEGRAPPPAR